MEVSRAGQPPHLSAYPFGERSTSVDIDAIDTDMHARAGDAELIYWLLVLDCAPQLSFCARHRGRVLSRWWFATVYDRGCLQPL